LPLLSPGILRGETDILISSCGLLSEFWSDTLTQYEGDEGGTSSSSSLAIKGEGGGNSGGIGGGNINGGGGGFLISSEGDFWKESMAATRPEYIARSVSLDLYNGSLTEDLRGLL
jgi:hypothetical protein